MIKSFLNLNSAMCINYVRCMYTSLYHRCHSVWYKNFSYEQINTWAVYQNPIWKLFHQIATPQRTASWNPGTSAFCQEKVRYSIEFSPRTMLVIYWGKMWGLNTGKYDVMVISCAWLCFNQVNIICVTLFRFIINSNCTYKCIYFVVT